MITMIDDPYVLEDGTLKNKLGITDYSKLKNAEADIGFVKLIDIDSIYEGELNSKLVRDLHKHIFEDIFDWAGEYRIVPIFKQEIVIPGLSLDYEKPQKISESLDKKIADLDKTDWKKMTTKQISLEFARKLALMWKVHPFRDGNTRTTLAFADLYAREHGFQFDIAYLLDNLTREINEDGRIRRYSIRDKFVLAALDDKDYPEPEHLAKLLEIAIEKGKEKEKEKRLVDESR